MTNMKVFGKSSFVPAAQVLCRITSGGLGGILDGQILGCSKMNVKVGFVCMCVGGGATRGNLHHVSCPVEKRLVFNKAKCKRVEYSRNICSSLIVIKAFKIFAGGREFCD